MNYTHISPAFAIHYNQGAHLNATVKRVFMDSETLIHEEIQMQREFQRRHTLFIPMKHPQLPAHDVQRHLIWMLLAQQDERRANDHIRQAIDFKVQSAIGFEPTEHSDSPPYIPTTPTSTPKPCIDFGFEPTEGCE